jgi:hypothetical protein
MFSRIMSAYRGLRVGMQYLNDPFLQEGIQKTTCEIAKRPGRTEVLNYLLRASQRRGKLAKTRYLEIGVRNPADNFNGVQASEKYGVDPGVEYKQNPVAFPMTSDLFFEGLETGKHLSPDYKFNVIFVDGLHLAGQVDRDISNAFKYLHDEGFVVLHDCNPPTEWHARESFEYPFTPARTHWNGTTWKAFVKWRSEPSVKSCCIDTDWGLGVLTKAFDIGEPVPPRNPFFEFGELQRDRKRSLNLVEFERFRQSIEFTL